jgi:hypothetical protein
MDGSNVRPGSVVSSVNAFPAPSGIGRHNPAKQNQSSPGLVNFHFDFGDLVPVLRGTLCPADGRFVMTTDMNAGRYILTAGGLLGPSAGPRS